MTTSAPTNSILSGITKLGEGYVFGNNEIPVDIHFHKIAEWLVDRKKLPRDWRKQHTQLTERIRKAVPQLPEGEFFNSLKAKPEDVNYFDCERVLKALEENGEDVSKNLFGQFNSSLMKEWSDIQKKYESTNTHLGEAANMLVTLSNQELPMLKRNAEAARKEVMEMERKEVEWNKQIVNFEQKFKQSCSNLGIKGVDIRSEILQTIEELNPIFEKIVSIVQDANFVEKIEFYEKFVETTCNSSSDENGFKLLRYVHLHGNPSLSDFENGVDPKQPKESSVQLAPANAGVEIDWAVIDDYQVNSSNAEKGKEAKKELTESVIHIDPSPSSSNPPADSATSEGIDWGAEEGGIVWDVDEISVEESSAPSIDLGNVIEVVEASEISSEKETLLGSSKKRRDFMDELLELSGFYEQRIEDRTSDDSLVVNVKDPKFQKYEGGIALKEAFDCFKKIIDIFENPRTKQLLEVKTSKRYVDRLVASLQHFLDCIERSKSSVRYSLVKKSQFQNQIAESGPQTEAIIAKMKDLKSKLETLLTKQYGRTITIIGDINKY